MGREVPVLLIPFSFFPISLLLQMLHCLLFKNYTASQKTHLTPVDILLVHTDVSRQGSWLRHDLEFEPSQIDPRAS